MGGHIEWLLSNEVLEAKARKWVGKNAEVKGKANLSIESFRDYLCGTYDHESRSWVSKGLLSDVLEAAKKTTLTLESARTYLHRCGLHDCVCTFCSWLCLHILYQ